MVHAEVPAGLEDIEESDYVRLDVGVGVVDGVSDACLGGEVEDDLRFELGEHPIKHFLIGEVSLDEGESVISRQHPKPSILQGHIVVVVAVVIADDGAASLQKEIMKKGKVFPYAPVG